jgi:hypothetical protein
MSITIPTSITGGAQTGFTSPTYTTVVDIYPGGVNGKQNAVTACGGTQTGARIHAVSDPFTLAVTRPQSPKALQSANPVTGRYGTIPKNTYSIIVRKGVNFAANQQPEVMMARAYLDIPAGSDSYDPTNVRAAISALVGTLTSISAGLGDTLVTGIL